MNKPTCEHCNGEGMAGLVKANQDLLLSLADKTAEDKIGHQIIKVSNQYIPRGAKLIEAYETESQFIILGDPNECEDENNPRYHNCDAMGCSTFSHVVARINK